MAEILETLMVIAFGLSWPNNIIKSWRARTTQGKIIMFLYFVFIGYLCGISAKLVSGHINYVFVFYILNSIMVLIDITLYYRNMKLDKRTG
jgi:bacteriorhodopsin